LTRQYKKQDPVERFLKHTESVDGCLLWTGQLRKGVGSFMDCYWSHSCRRWAWINIAKRDLRDNQVLVMSCGSATCVDTDHMEAIKKGSQRSYYKQ
jgi:hypothetical protein